MIIYNLYRIISLNPEFFAERFELNDDYSKN